MSGLSRLGQQIAREQDALRGARRDRARVREQLGALDLAPSPAHAPRRIYTAIACSAAAALALAAAAALWARPAPDALSVTKSGANVREGAWIEAGRLEPTQLRFSDGTRVDMAPRARVRVVELEAAGAHLLLESGHARVAVVPDEKASWRLSVGPFVVRVTGTRFDVRWDPEQDAFALDLEHGSVEITGCVFGHGYIVTAGQAVQASCKRGRLNVDQRGRADAAAQDRGPAPAVAVREQAAPPGAAEDAREVLPAAGDAPVAPARRNRPGWRALAAQGKYAPAFAAADAAGFEAECARADAQELAMLADTARHARRPEQEAHALLLLRRRFAGTPRAAFSAYALGRLEFDRHHSYDEAAEWFGTYLKEQPEGPLTREARGRLMEATFRAGDAERARELARGYLREYPAGPHAQLARALRARR